MKTKMKTYVIENHTRNEKVTLKSEYELINCIIDLFKDIYEYDDFMDLHDWFDDDYIEVTIVE